MLRVESFIYIDRRYLKKGGTIMIAQQQAQASTAVKEPLWRVLLFSILGIALPLVAGSMVWWPWGVPDFLDSPWVLDTVILAALMSVAAGAFLLCLAFRVWWVAVFVAVAWIVGEFLGVLVRTLLEGSSLQLQAWDPFWSVQIGLICMALMPLFLGAAIGASGGLALGKRGASRP
jgi:hypothetical protein